MYEKTNSKQKQIQIKKLIKKYKKKILSFLFPRIVYIRRKRLSFSPKMADEDGISEFFSMRVLPSLRNTCQRCQLICSLLMQPMIPQQNIFPHGVNLILTPQENISVSNFYIHEIFLTDEKPMKKSRFFLSNFTFKVSKFRLRRNLPNLTPLKKI